MATQFNQSVGNELYRFYECVERSQKGGFAEEMIITPELASLILDSNPNNRPLNQASVYQYAKDMINGHWQYNMETIIISKSGELNNGQHRLNAVVESGIAQKFLVAFGAERETRTTVDQGKARTAGHYLSMNGVKNANLCAAVTALVMSYEDSKNTVKNNSKHSHAEIVGRVETDALIHEAAHFSATVNRYAQGLLSASRIGFAYYIFARLSPSDAKEFMTQVCVGENIKRGDPAFAVRQALPVLEDRSVKNQMELVMRGWNAYRQKRSLKLAKNLGVLPVVV